MTPAELSRQLRQGRGAFLALRRTAVALSLLTEGALAVISLYQIGLIRHVPEPPLPHFDADKVNASPDAYRRLNMPDGILGMGSYAVTMALAAAGGEDRVSSSPWLPLALAGKVGLDTAIAVQLTLDQARKQHAFCLWCLLTSAASFATAPLVVPEAHTALRRLISRNL